MSHRAKKDAFLRKKAIVIGASSGIGKELAIVLSQNGYSVGLTGRRLHLLEELKTNLSNPAFLKQVDVSDNLKAMDLLKDLIEEMRGVDLVIISAGTGFINSDLKWTDEKKTIDVNVSGFVAMANIAYRHFEQVGRGLLVGISSVAAIRGSGDAPAYNASKAFISHYLEGLKIRALKAGLPLIVTDIKPGFVDTAMAKSEGLFWVAPPRKAAGQIYGVIQRKARHAYVTKRWFLVGWLLRILPGFLYARL